MPISDWSSDVCSSDLAPDALRVIAGHKSGDRRVKAGQKLLSLGEPCNAIYNLVDGWMVLYNLLEDGRRQILHFALPGAVLGFHPAHGAMMTYGAQALTDAVVCVIPPKALRPLTRDRKRNPRKPSHKCPIRLT